MCGVGVGRGVIVVAVVVGSCVVVGVGAARMSVVHVAGVVVVWWLWQ